MLIPPAWQHDDSLAAGRSARSTTTMPALVEPWDGPAALVFTDGRVVGAALDRNGLRPLRYAVTAGGLVACASEAGAIPLAATAPRSARTGSGRASCSPSIPGLGLEADARDRAPARRQRPYGRWLARGGVPIDSRRARRSAPSLGPDRRARSRPATRARTSRSLLRPSAADGHEPTSSMGDDTALPPLAGRARPVFSYLRQRFAQVTNPPIDHLRERVVDVAADAARPRVARCSRATAPEAARLLELESFFLYPSAVAGARRERRSRPPLDDDESLRGRVPADRAMPRWRLVGARRGRSWSSPTTGVAASRSRRLLALGAVQQRLVSTAEALRDARSSS